MSTAENIALWKRKSEIDYIPPFMSLWLALNAWLKDRYIKITQDRACINLLKNGGHQLSAKFEELINGKDAKSTTFKGYFAELHSALENANIRFKKQPGELPDNHNKKVSFKNTILDWQDGSLVFDSVVKTKEQKNRVEISSTFYIDNDIPRVFRAYIENLYQLRCELFHGNLIPEKDNERVVKMFYLTLSMIMEGV